MRLLHFELAAHVPLAAAEIAAATAAAAAAAGAVAGVRKQGDNVMAGVRVQFVLVRSGLSDLTLMVSRQLKMGAKSLFFGNHRHIAVIIARRISVATVAVREIANVIGIIPTLTMARVRVANVRIAVVVIKGHAFLVPGTRKIVQKVPHLRSFTGVPRRSCHF